MLRPLCMYLSRPLRMVDENFRSSCVYCRSHMVYFYYTTATVSGSSVTKFQTTSYQFNKCLKHATIHPPLRNRAKSPGFSSGFEIMRIWVQFSTNSNPGGKFGRKPFADKPIFKWLTHTSHGRLRSFGPAKRTEFKTRDLSGQNAWA